MGKDEDAVFVEESLAECCVSDGRVDDFAGTRSSCLRCVREEVTSDRPETDLVSFRENLANWWITILTIHNTFSEAFFFSRCALAFRIPCTYGYESMSIESKLE